MIKTALTFAWYGLVWVIFLVCLIACLWIVVNLIHGTIQALQYRRDVIEKWPRDRPHHPNRSTPTWVVRARWFWIIVATIGALSGLGAVLGPVFSL